MFILVWLLSTALAQEVTCDDLLQMLSVGMPESYVVEMLEKGAVTHELADCLAEGNAPAAVLSAARNAPKVQTLDEGKRPRTVEDTRPPQTPTDVPERITVNKPVSFSQHAHAADLREWIRKQYQLPSRGVASAYSIFPGYGVGHYYAGSLETGTAFLLTDLVATTMMLSPFFSSPTVQTGRISIAGGLVLFLSRLVATMTAPSFARKTALARFH